MSANEVHFNVHDHGVAIDEQKRRIKCNYCDKVVSGFTRLKSHLGGIRGDVTPCQKVPTELKDIVRNQLLEHKRGSLSKEVGELVHPNLPWKRNWSPNSNVVNHNELETKKSAALGNKKRCKVDSSSDNSVDCVSSPKRTTGSQEAENRLEGSSMSQLQKCIGRFFYENGIEFGAVRSPSFQKMINATLSCGPMRYKIPSCQDLKGLILQDEMKEIQQYVKDIRNSWPSTGCSIILDGWIDDKGRNLINILVDCPRGPIYLRSCDISAFINDSCALQLLFDNVIREVGVENVVQVMTFSTSTCMEAVGKELMEKHRTVFWTVSASHCIGLMLEDIQTMLLVRKILEKAKTITKFIHSRPKILKLFRQLSSGCDLFKPSKIRSAAPFLTLENIVSEKESLEKLILSSECSSSTWTSSGGKRVADLVTDSSFWNGAMAVLKATIPLVRVLNLIDEGEKSQLGYIYETIDQAKETIKEEFNEKKGLYSPFWKAIDDIWDPHLYSPLHAAGYFLNPCLFYSSDFYTDAEVASGLLCCIVRMLEDKHIQDLVTLQVDKYRAGDGDFAQGTATDRRSNIPPAQWWSKYGGHCRELQRFAIRILSQTCNGASKYGLKRSMAEKLLTEGRNCIEQQRLSDLTFVHYNLQLRNFVAGINTSVKVEEIDPMDDWIVE